MSKYRPKKDSDQWRETILEARKSGLSDQMHQVSDVVNPMTVKAFEATIRITMGGSTLELTNDADPMVVGPLLKVLKSSC